MIFGTGVDIVRVDRMRTALARFGERFARRLLTDTELEEFRVASSPPHFLAKRFAAKEAAVKALGTGFSDGIRPAHIGVARPRHGRPTLNFHGPAAECLRTLGIGETHLSLSDEQEYAVAFVILLRSGPEPAAPTP